MTKIWDVPLKLAVIPSMQNTHTILPQLVVLQTTLNANKMAVKVYKLLGKLNFSTYRYAVN